MAKFVPSKIAPGLWVGSCWDANGSFIRSAGIDRVLSVCHSIPSPSVADVATCHSICVEDSPDEDILDKFAEANEFISGGENILVHCDGGISRSPSFVMAYLMWKDGISAREAADIVNAGRPFINPNRGFRAQLRKYDRMLHNIPSPKPRDDIQYVERPIPTITLPKHIQLRACSYV